MQSCEMVVGHIADEHGEPVVAALVRLPVVLEQILEEGVTT